MLRFVIPLHRSSAKKIVFSFLLLPVIFNLGCKYEGVGEVESGSEIGLIVNDSGEEGEEGEEGAEIAASLPSLPFCDGECTCDEVVFNANDSGITFGADGEEQNLSYCNDFDSIVQDCNHGRDRETSLIKVGGGSGGFDFSKVDDDGGLLSFDERDWTCVLDNHSGLMWEVKRDEFSDELRNKTNTFSWSNNALPEYSTSDGGKCNVSGECGTQAYVMAVNREGLCGFNDWRLPDKMEFQDLVHYGKSEPSIDVNYFPHTAVGFYWSSTIDSDDVGSAWAVGFHFGRVAGGSSRSAHYIRLVRSHHSPEKPALSVTLAEQDPRLRDELAPLQRCNSKAALTSPISRFKQDDLGNVLDTYTGLIWRRCVAGMSGQYCSKGRKNFMSWVGALEYAAEENSSLNAAETPWRIPNIKELQRTVETQCEEPALNPFVFPNIPLDNVWSSTPHARQSTNSYYFQYQNSIIFYGSRRDKHMVHLVRDCR